jgi:membrane fusion protein, copper/silver efflux system
MIVPISKSVRAIFVALLAASLGAGCSRSHVEPVVVDAGPMRIKLTLRTDPPQQEGNVLDVEIEDDSGERMAGADVDVEYSMPAMGAMPEMRGKADVTPQGAGLYRVDFDLPMGGSWALALRVKHEKVSAELRLRLTIGTSGLTVESTANGSGTPPAAGAEQTGAARSLALEPHAEGAANDDQEIAYYTCSMHPSVRSATPGICPICSMTLVPVRRTEAQTAVVTIPPERLQAIGVRTAPAARRPFDIAVATVGRVSYDETELSDISVKYEGWIGTLYANSTGQYVERGKPLFTLYSPALFSAQQELLSALRSRRDAAGTTAPDRADYLVDAARARLRLWDLDDTQIDAIARRGSPLEQVPILARASGYVIEKNVVEGAAVAPGERLYRIAGLDTVWIDVDVYEPELALVRVGAPAAATFPYLPGRSFEGRVSFIYPYLRDATRTARVRLEVKNEGLELKPDMYADVSLHLHLGERLAIPEEAILYTGPRRFVFVDLGEGRLAPRQVHVGHTAGEYVEILDGLDEGETVVTSGNFLIAAESRLKLAVEQWQ